MTKAEERAALEAAMAEFEARGGQVEVLPDDQRSARSLKTHYSHATSLHQIAHVVGTARSDQTLAVMNNLPRDVKMGVPYVRMRQYEERRTRARMAKRHEHLTTLSRYR